MNKAEQQAWQTLISRKPHLVATIHVQNRPRAAGAWFVCILNVGGTGHYLVTVTRHYRGALPPPADWNPRRTEIVLANIKTLAEARATAEGFALGKWGRWTI